MTVSSQLRLVVAFLCSFFIVLLPFLHAYANNVTNVQLPISGFTNDLMWLTGFCFTLVWVVLKLLPAEIETKVIILLGIVNAALWLQINFFIGTYGFLDGGEPDWASNSNLGIIQLTSFTFIAVLFIKFRQTLLDNFIFGAVLLVFSSLAYVPQLLEQANKPLQKKYTFTKKGIYELSPERNIIIFIVDTMQADIVNEIFEEATTLQDSFNGFTFFRNSLSSFPKTYASIPAILSGRSFDNSQTLSDYLWSAYILESLPAYLKKENFDVRHWSSSPQSLIAHPFVSDNVADTQGQAMGKSTIGVRDRELVFNMMLFRLAPHFLKPWVYNNSEFRIDLAEPDLAQDSNQQLCNLKDSDRLFSREIKTFDTAFVDEFELCASVGTAKPVYRFYHLYGAHPPLQFDKDFHFIGNQKINRKNFKAQTHGSLQLLSGMLEKIKDLGIYDNSTILILGDHGDGEYWTGLNLDQPGLPPPGAAKSELSKQIVKGGIPLILVKPANSNHQVRVTDAPVELTDVPATILKDLGHESGSFSGSPMYSIAPDSRRVRYFKYYQFSGWNIDYLLPMTEYAVDGFSWYPGSWGKSSRDLNANAQTHFDGTLVTLLEGGNLESFDSTGFSAAGKIGRTIADREANLKLTHQADKPTLLSIVHYLYENASRPEERVRVLIGSEPVGTWTFLKDDGQRKKFLLLSIKQTKALETLPLEFQLEQPVGNTIIREIRLTSADRYQYKLGSNISFTDTGNSDTYRTYGWSRTEYWGTSSIGPASGVFLYLGREHPQELVMEFKASGYVYENWPQQEISVLVNGVVAGVITLNDRKKNSHQIRFEMDPESEGALNITFQYANAVRPSDIGTSGDKRLQAIAMENLKVSTP